jgi:hypothetical protein
MSKFTMFVPARSLCLAGLLVLAHAPAAFAEKIDFMTEDELKSKCSVAGGTFMPSGGGSRVYACIGKGDNGAVIACGGDMEYAGTCDVTPPGRKIVDVQRLLRLRSATAVQGLSTGN